MNGVRRLARWARGARPSRGPVILGATVAIGCPTDDVVVRPQIHAVEVANRMDDADASAGPRRLHDETVPAGTGVLVADAHDPSVTATPRRLDPRTPPFGISPEAALAFSKLPVSADDRPPIGGVGLSGIHVDRIDMGTAFERSRCEDLRHEFSISRHRRANICFRVVHKREKESLTIVWRRLGGIDRRMQMTVKPIHAYRTRAYLVLRREYVGPWAVQILSEDGVELATNNFAIVD